MRFESPLFLLLAFVAVWCWRAARHSSASSASRGLRLAAIVCLTLALGGLQLQLGTSPQSVMFVVDESGSMAGLRAESAQRVRSLAAGMGEADQAGLIVFGADAAVERPLANAFEWRGSRSASVGSTTDIETALRLARAALSGAESKRVVLVSDGRETRGDAMAEATRAALAGISIDVATAAASSVAPLDVMQVAAPATARLDDPFAVTVSARGLPGTRGMLTLTTPGAAPQTAPVTIAADGFATASFPVQSGVAGIHVYEATAAPLAAPADIGTEPRRAGAVVSIAGDTRVLYVGTTPEVMTPLAATAGFRLRSTSAALFPRSASQLADSDLIVLDAVRPDAIDAAQTAALRSHVEQQGGGLLVLGDRNSLDAGLLANHVLGGLLPVDVRPRGGQRAPALGLVVAFDKSGSMDDRVDGVPRIEFARLAVRRVFDAIPASDAVGVIAFDAEAHVVAPLRAGHDVATLATTLQAVQPSGSTAIAPALAMASAWFAATDKGLRRHVLLVSDGRTSAADAARVREIVEAGGFQLSVVALGTDADRQLLQSLAQLSGGRAYFPGDVRELPALVARETARVAGGTLVEAPFQPVGRAHPILTGLPAPWPSLGGYVVSAVKASAESPLVSPLEDPILATWRVGLGRVAVYTAELNGSWSARLRQWEGLRGLLTGIVRWTSRSAHHGVLYASLEEGSDGIRLLVEAGNEQGPLNELQCHAEVRAPGGETATIVLHATAPGRYEAQLPAVEPGAYVVAVAASSRDGRFDARIVRGVYWSADAEYRDPTPHLALLTRVANITGGRMLEPGDGVFDGPRAPAYLDTWPWLALTALTLFVIEILLPSLGAARPGLRPRPPPDTLHTEAAA